MKQFLLVVLSVSLLTLSACTQDAPLDDENNQTDDPDEQEETDTIPPLFRNLSHGLLPRLDHDSGEMIDVFEAINVVDNETPTDEIVLSIADDGGYDYQVPGMYTLTIAAEDESGNVAYAPRRIVVHGELGKDYGDAPLVVEHHLEDDVPYTTHYYDDGTAKPVIFYFHGFGSDRISGDQGRGEKLASLGFFVIAIDAYEHGDRRSDAFDALSGAHRQREIVNVVMHTANDAVNLYESHYRDHPLTLEDELYAFGVSMGAATAFYMSSITEVDAMVSLLGSPSFVDFYAYKQQQYGWDDDKYHQDNLALYETHDPLIHHDRLKNTSIFMTVGESDSIVPLTYAFELYQKVERYDVIYEAYATGHMSTQAMLDDAYYFLQGEIINLSS